jgi:hypothetical protein
MLSQKEQDVLKVSAFCSIHGYPKRLTSYTASIGYFEPREYLLVTAEKKCNIFHRHEVVNNEAYGTKQYDVGVAGKTGHEACRIDPPATPNQPIVIRAKCSAHAPDHSVLRLKGE